MGTQRCRRQIRAPPRCREAENRSSWPVRVGATIGAARLLFMKLGSPPHDAQAVAAEAGAVALPILKACRDVVAPVAVYKERELIALYVETYPLAPSSATPARNRRPLD